MEQGAWIPFKDLWNTTQEFALQNSQTSFHKLKSLLRRHKPEFVSLLKNAAPNSEHRAKVKNANTVGLPLEGEGPSGKILEEAFIEESIILSDLFHLNEFSAVELLLAAQQQVPNYPNYSRGLVAVLLYWDGRRNLVNVLKTLIQCRKGRTWTLDLPQDAVNLATTFTNELIESGLTKQILKLLVDIQTEPEMEKLSSQRGLGDAKHRKQVRDLITEIRQCLSECLFYLAGQSGLSANDAIDIIKHLQKNTEEESDGKMSSSTLALIFALLYSFSLPCDAQTDSDTQSIAELLSHPLLSDKKFLPLVHKVLNQECGHSGSWKTPGIKACLQFGFSICLRTVSQIPIQLFAGTKTIQPNVEILEQDENILEACLQEKAFLFIRQNIVETSGFHMEEFYLRQIHNLLTDLIVNMPLKVKDMRNHGDEVARIVMLHLMEGEDPPPELRKDFEQLMQLITSIYDKDPLNLQLSYEFWCPNESALTMESGTYIHSPNKHHQRASHKQMALFKFIRQSGDLLPPLLYIPYLHMLAALSTGSRSARVAFEMLKANGANMVGTGESSTISWEHFFTSCQQYYNNLRQDHPIHDVTTSFAQHHHHHAAQNVQARTITPQELKGLQAVMQLMAKILQYDEIACITVYEQSQWSACAVLFGLLQCPIPVVLKGDILNVLTQLARIPDIAMGILQGMDSAQFLQMTDGFGSTTKPVGLLSELEEVEARDEEFPMSRGFLKLLGTLIESGASLSVLGEGSRTPGFEPYLAFAIESVFLKFHSRSYARPEEKWEVASCCLQMFNNLLHQYQPHPQHFHTDKPTFAGDSMTQQSSFLHDTSVRSNMTTQKVAKVPGFSLLLYIFNEGNFFKVIMHIISECISYLDKHKPRPNVEKSLVEAASLSMQFLYNALQLQDSFLSCMRESDKPLLITTLDKLLLGVNTKTGKADYMVSIAKFVIHNATQSQLTLLATKVISWLCFSSVMTHREVVMVMINSCGLMTRQKILHGFVEVLDTVCPESDDINDNDPVTYMSQCRLALLRLLVHCVDLPAPNLSQFLLGFDITKPSTVTSLQDPGIMSTPRSCLHSVLTILSLGMDAGDPGIPGQPFVITENPKLAELSYQLLYRLSANSETSGPIMRYLRSSYDFVYKHLQILPVSDPENSQPNNNMMMQQAWLLKMAAIELYSLAAKQQRTNAQRILQLLFDYQTKAGIARKTMNNTSMFGQSFDPGHASVRSLFANRSSMTGTSILNVTDGADLPQDGATEQMKVLLIFDKLDFSQEFPTALTLEQFVPTVVEQAIASCETTNEHGVQYCDIKALHELLKATLGTLTATDDVNRRQMAGEDVQKILNTAVERNKTRETVHAKLSFLSAWRHTIEIALTACPVDLFPSNNRRQALLEIAQHLVNKVRHSDAVQELTSPVAGIVLTLVMQIRSCFMKQKSFSSASHLSMLENHQLSDLLNAENEMEIDINDVAPLQVVVRGVLEWLLQSGLGEKVRTNMYATLLYYMQLCRRPSGGPSGRRETTGVLASFEDSYSKINRENFRLIRDYGDSLMNLISKDACTGQNVCRVLALACLDSIIQIDSQQIWLQHMVQNGSLNHIVHSIAAEDESLQQYLRPNSEPLRSVYIYEQKMALLCGLVQTTAGARAAIESGVLSRLAEVSFLDMRPNTDNTEFSTMLPGVLSRYRQLLIPALQLCSAILTTLGGSNHYEASALSLQFLLAHSDSIIIAVLRISSIPTDLQALTELKLVTSILSQTAAQDYSDPTLFGNVPQGHLAEIQGHMLMVQRQLLSILPHFFLSEPTLNEMQRKAEAENTLNQFPQVTSLCYEIGANVLTYCRAVALRSSDVTDSSVLLFAPELSETSSVTYGSDDFRNQTCLGVLLRILRSVTARYNTQNEEQKREKRKLENIDTLSAQDLKEIINIVGSEKLSITQEQELASAILRKLIRQKGAHLNCLYYIVENCLLLVWQHLDYYVLRSEPLEAPNSNILFPNRSKAESFSRSSLRRLQDISNLGEDSFVGTDGAGSSQVFGKQIGIRRADVDRLKQELPTCLPDHFLQKVSQMEVQTRSATSDFIRPLVRRLQHIVKLHASSSK